MLLPVFFNDMVDDYWHLRQHVQLWDVSVERQVSIKGKDTARLVQMMTPRDISKCQIKQCYYAPLCDEFGGIVNDPIILKLAEDHFWLSIADSDVLLWAKGLAYGLKLDVMIEEPYVNPLAVQGPKSDALMAKIFGDTVTKLRFFWFDYFQYKNHPFLIARSGWSKQGGFEIYMDNQDLAHDLWQHIMRVGQEFNIRQGCPHAIERVESGLLSYGNDMTLEHNPFEARLDKYVTLQHDTMSLSQSALRDIQHQGVSQRIEAIFIDGEKLSGLRYRWDIKNKHDVICGYVTSMAYSLLFQSNIALAMISATATYDDLYVTTTDGDRKITVSPNFPFDLPSKS